jgi:CBS domain containing-hemolysin-like protein
VRFDEIAEFLNLELHPEESTTDSVAEIIVRELDRMPKLGDAVETALGLLRVENMARRRITRVRVHPKRDPVIGDS